MDEDVDMEAEITIEMIDVLSLIHKRDDVHLLGNILSMPGLLQQQETVSTGKPDSSRKKQPDGIKICRAEVTSNMDSSMRTTCRIDRRTTIG